MYGFEIWDLGLNSQDLELNEVTFGFGRTRDGIEERLAIFLGLLAVTATARKRCENEVTMNPYAYKSPKRPKP